MLTNGSGYVILNLAEMPWKTVKIVASINRKQARRSEDPEGEESPRTEPRMKKVLSGHGSLKNIDFARV